MVMVIPIVNGLFRTISKGLAKELEGLEITRDYPDNSIIKIRLNTKNIPRCWVSPTFSA